MRIRKRMGQAIGDFLPSAVGVAISPLPIVAVVLMLVTPRGRTNGPAFVAGWCIGLAIVGAIVLTVAGGASASTDSGPATWVDVLFLILGLLLILVAAKQWRGRPHDEEPPTPEWMGALDEFSRAKAGAAARRRRRCRDRANRDLDRTEGRLLRRLSGNRLDRRRGPRRHLLPNGRTIRAPPGRAQDLARPQTTP